MQTCKGSIHDFKLYKDTYPDWLPCDAKLLADSGYQGLAKLHEQSFTPFIKPQKTQKKQQKKKQRYFAYCLNTIP